MFRILPIFVALGVVAMFARSSTAELVRETRDTESLAIESRLIVAATIDCEWTERTRDDAKVGVTRVVVDRVIAGPRETIGQWDGADTVKRDYSTFKLAAGDHLDVACLDLYSISPDLAGGTRRGLAKGDRVVLFLMDKRDRAMLFSAWQQTSANWALPFNALRLIVGTNTYAFVQHWGKFQMSSTTETATPVLFPEVTPLALDELDRRIQKAIADAPALQRTIDTATRADVPALLEICRSRKDALPGEVVPARHWPLWAGAKIQEVADPQMLADYFVSEQRMHQDNFHPQYGLSGRVETRELILQKLEAGSIPSDRLRDAFDVFSDGRDYRAPLQVSSRLGSPPPHGGRLATRLAKVALRVSDPKQLWFAYGSIRNCLPFINEPSFPALDNDLVAAADVLVEGWPTLNDDQRCEAAITLAFIDVKQLQRVMPSGGLFVSQLKPRSYGAVLDQKRQLHLSYKYNNVLKKSDAPMTLWLVLRSADGKREFERSFENEHAQLRENGGRGSGGEMSLDIALPEGVTAGTYHAFIRARSEGKNLADGIGCDIVVPQN